MDEAELAVVVVGERELVVAAAVGHEAAVQLRSAGTPAVPRVWMAAALPFGGAHRRCVTRLDRIALWVQVGGLLQAVHEAGLTQPTEVVVERAVLHHHDHEVVDRHLTRGGERGSLRRRGLLEQQVGGQEAGGAGEAGGVRGSLEELASAEFAHASHNVHEAHPLRPLTARLRARASSALRPRGSSSERRRCGAGRRAGPRGRSARSSSLCSVSADPASPAVTAASSLRKYVLMVDV